MLRVGGIKVRTWTVLVSALIVAATAVTVASPALGVNYEQDWYDLDTSLIVVPGESHTFVSCWDVPIRGSLKVKHRGRWLNVDSQSTRRNLNLCTRKYPNYLKVTWNVDLIAPVGSNGSRVISFALTDNRGTTEYAKVTQMTQAEWADYESSEDGSADKPASEPSPSPPAATPAPAAWSAPDTTTWSQAEIRFVQYLSSGFRSATTGNQLELCRAFSNPAEDGSNRMFYDHVADQGVSQYGLDRTHARPLGVQLYSGLCRALFGLSTRNV
jgi:hypothetical protein